MTIFYTEVLCRYAAVAMAITWCAAPFQEVRRLNLTVEPDCGFVREVIKPPSR